MFVDYCKKEIIAYIRNSVGAFLESRCTFTCSTVRLVARSRDLSKRQLSKYRIFILVVSLEEWGCRGWGWGHFKPLFGDITLIQ